MIWTCDVLEGMLRDWEGGREENFLNVKDSASVEEAVRLTIYKMIKSNVKQILRRRNLTGERVPLTPYM